jgi:AraC-like DNA-binding protein/quercetin dioxygenase-like cupin family protein
LPMKATLNAKQTRTRFEKLQVDQNPRFGFALHEKAVRFDYDWHSHARHQLIYSLSGRIILQSRDARWLLPPQRAAWIPAGVEHKTTLDRAEAVSVYFKSFPRGKGGDIHIIRANTLMREMLVYAGRWPANKDMTGKESPLRKSYFETLANLCLDWIQQELPFRLPEPKHPDVQKAVQHLLANLDTADLENAAKASSQSTRTLRRRFLPDTGLTWQQYALHARMLHAMDALMTTRQSVLEVSLAIGYASPSAFTTAFLGFTGTTPAAFRRGQGLPGIETRKGVEPSFHFPN